VLRLWRIAFNKKPHEQGAHLYDLEKAAADPQRFILARADHEVVGTVIGTTDGYRGWMYYLAVLPEYRKQSIGRKLVNLMEDVLGEAGCHHIGLLMHVDNRQVEGFYHGLGYQMTPYRVMGRFIKSRQRD